MIYTEFPTRNNFEIIEIKGWLSAGSDNWKVISRGPQCKDSNALFILEESLQKWSNQKSDNFSTLLTVVNRKNCHLCMKGYLKLLLQLPLKLNHQIGNRLSALFRFKKFDLYSSILTNPFLFLISIEYYKVVYGHKNSLRQTI